MESSPVVEHDVSLTEDNAKISVLDEHDRATHRRAEPTENLLTKTLNSLRLENRWNECLDTWDDAEPEEVLEVHLMAAQVRQQFLDAAAQVSSDEELAQTVLLIYIQLRAHWYLLNLRLGYSAESGVLDNTLAYQASLLAILVQTVEAVVDRRVVERVTEMLDSPLTDYDAAAGEESSYSGTLSAADFSGGTAISHENGWATGANEEEAGMLRGRVQALADTLGDLSDRLSRQSSEMIVMKATQCALTETLGEADPTRLVARVMQLSAKIVALEAQLESAGIHRELFAREFGTSEPFAMATVVQSLRAQVASLSKPASGGGVMGGVTSRNNNAAVHAISTTRIEELTAALQTEREAKAQAQAQSVLLETQLQSFRNEQESLASELGLTDAAQIVTKVKSLTERLAAVKDLEMLLGTMESELSGSPR
ncbi:MAG: hypothetical protein H8F28_23755 [Fibrella sp.]|nr:hypothetical protein [Armatimonadota bacterium]